MSGAWSNGAYTIEQVDEDYVKVTKHGIYFDKEAVLCGGDFETVLDTLFVGAEITNIRKANEPAHQSHPKK